MKQRLFGCLFAMLAIASIPACGDDDDTDDDGVTESGGGTSGRGGATSGGAGGANAGRGGGANAGRGGGANAGASGGGGANVGGSGGATAGAGAIGGEGGAAAAGGAAGDAGDAGAAGAAGAGGAGNTLSDAEVLHVVITANTGEVTQAEVALMRANDEDVRAFAELMIEEHGTAITETETLAEAEDLDPAANPVSAALEAESEQIVAALRSATDTEFDVLYMESQVAAHQEVLTLIDAQLLPSAEDADVDALLTDLRGHVAMHLEEAEAILESLQ